MRKLGSGWLTTSKSLAFLAVSALMACDAEQLGKLAQAERASEPPPTTAPAFAEPPPPWKPLADDGVHDPTAPGLAFLQQPSEALAVLPPDSVGNRVRWVEAIDDGAIAPRTRLDPTTRVQLRRTAIYLDIGGAAGIVRFPHREHSIWLDCRNCHSELFEMRAGETMISMSRILEGERCGLCHGAVSFPLTECGRCHSLAQPRLRSLLERTECREAESEKLVVICDE